MHKQTAEVSLGSANVNSVESRMINTQLSNIASIQLPLVKHTCKCIKLRLLRRVR